jgi:hypothetical protein
MAVKKGHPSNPNDRSNEPTDDNSKANSGVCNWTKLREDSSNAISILFCYK